MKRTLFNKKILLTAATVLLVAFIFSLYWCDHVITQNAAGKLYSSADEVPYCKVGLLLGTSKYSAPGRLNPFYVKRIAAAVALMQHNRVKYIIISGDNGRKTYSEPEDMRADLVNAGIDSSRIYLDYAGFRTFDSMVRLEKIFGETTVTVISQQFHNERAIYIASRMGLHAVGFNAGNVGDRSTMWREKLARVKVFLDFLLGKKPRYLGQRVLIPA